MFSDADGVNDECERGGGRGGVAYHHADILLI